MNSTTNSGSTEAGSTNTGIANPWLYWATTGFVVFIGTLAAGIVASKLIPKPDSAGVIADRAPAVSAVVTPEPKELAEAVTPSVDRNEPDTAARSAPIRLQSPVEIQVAQAPPPAKEKPTHTDTTDTSAKTPPAKTPPAATDDPARHAAYKRAAAAARSAMAARDLPLAKRSVKTATTNAQSAAEVAEANRLQTLEDSVKQFWDGIRNSVSKLESTEELVLPNNDRVAVIEASRDGLSVMYEGKPREFRITTLPMGLLATIVKSSFKLTPGTKIIIGSFLAMDKEGDRARARQLWQEASKAGEPLGKELMPELDVPLSGGKGK